MNDQQPVVDGLLSQADTWISQYQEASTNLSDLQKIASAARQQLASMPQDLLLAEPDNRLKKLAATINDLNDRLAHPQAGQLTGYASEARLAGKAAQDLSQQLENARQHQGELVKAMLTTWRSTWKCWCARWATSRSAPLTPWCGIRVRLRWTSCRRRPANWASPGCRARQPRSKRPWPPPESCWLAPKILTDHFHLVAEKYEEFQPLLDVLDARQSLDWCHTAQALATQVQPYHPDNWPRQDAVNKFKIEVQMLAELLPTLLPVKGALPVKGTELNDRLEKLRQLAVLYQSLRARETSIHQRLDEILAMEKDAQDGLASARTVLNQVGLLANANPILLEAAKRDQPAHR